MEKIRSFEILKQFGSQFILYIFILLSITITTILISDDFGIKVLTFLGADVGADFWLTSWTINKKYLLKKDEDFNESHYDLYWKSNKLRIKLIIQVILICFASYKYILDVYFPNYLKDVDLLCLLLYKFVLPGIVILLISTILSSFIIFSVPNCQVVENLYEESKNDFKTKNQHKKLKNKKFKK